MPPDHIWDRSDRCRHVGQLVCCARTEIPTGSWSRLLRGLPPACAGLLIAAAGRRAERAGPPPLDPHGIVRRQSARGYLALVALLNAYVVYPYALGRGPGSAMPRPDEGNQTPGVAEYRTTRWFFLQRAGAERGAPTGASTASAVGFK